MKRGVLYIVWPGRGVEAQLTRSMRSVHAHHPELGVRVERLPVGSSLLDKARMMELSPFESTLFLDADTVVLGDLTEGFDRAEATGVACCICECPWARRYPSLSQHRNLIEYNTGVLFFTNYATELFKQWQRLSTTLDSRLPFKTPDGPCEMECNDQASFAEAVRITHRIPHVLPLNWNFRPRWHHGAFGPIKVWHDPCVVPDAVHRWNEQQEASETVEFLSIKPERKPREVAAAV